MRIRKAVIPAAGLGTRFLPVTKSVPKVMIPVLDKPAIHYCVEEAARAGIEQIILVISHGQESVAHYFDRAPELERELEQRGHAALLKQVTEISEMAEVACVYQEQQLGLGHAVLTAKDAVGKEPFAVLLPDDLVWSEVPTIGAIAEVFAEHRNSVLAVREVPDEAVSRLGIIDPEPIDDRVSRAVRLVEKPALGEAPSNLAIVGRYVLTPEVFEALERVQPGALGEIQLTDAIAMLLATQQVYAYRFPGVHFDIGTPQGLLKASVYAALHRDDIAGDIRDWLADAL